MRMGGWVFCLSFGCWYVSAEYGQGFRLMVCERASSAAEGFVIVRSDLGYCYVSVCMDGSWVVRGGLNCGW